MFLSHFAASNLTEEEASKYINLAIGPLYKHYVTTGFALEAVLDILKVPETDIRAQQRSVFVCICPVCK